MENRNEVRTTKSPADVSLCIKEKINKEYNTTNCKLLGYSLIDTDIRGSLISITSLKNSIIYRVKLLGGNVYIGQTDTIEARRKKHKLKFGENFVSMDVINSSPAINSEIDYISRYRAKLGRNRVVNISDGSAVY